MFRNLKRKILIRLYGMAKAEYQNNIYEGFRKVYKISNKFRFNGDDILFYGKGEIVCGENSYIGAYSTVLSYEGTRVEIGTNCSISHNVRMYTNTYEADQDFSKKELMHRTGSIIIGNNVWIGANVFIGPGVVINDNSIVGANSVVTKNIEAFTIVGGVPAVLLRRKKL